MFRRVLALRPHTIAERRALARRLNATHKILLLVIAPSFSSAMDFGPQPRDACFTIDSDIASALGQDVSEEFQAQAQRMPALSRKLLIFGQACDSVDPTDLFHELALPEEVEEEARHGLASSASVLRRRAVLSHDACSTLRSAVDSEWQEKVDTVDGAPDHQLNLSREQLEKLIGADAITSLMSAGKDFATSASAGGAAGGSGTSPLHLDNATKIFVRRYERSQRPWNPFHTDTSALTINVALNDDSSFVGGKLLCAFDRRIQRVDRVAGEATVHASTLLHGVSRLQSGVRYSLIIFMGERHLLPARLRFDEASRNSEASALACLVDRLAQMVTAPVQSVVHEQRRVAELLAGSRLVHLSSEETGNIIQAIIQTYDAPHLRPTSILARAKQEGDADVVGAPPGDKSESLAMSTWWLSLRALLKYAESV